MKKKLIIFGIFSLIFVIVLTINLFLKRGSEVSGKIKIVTSPDAGVFIDNVPVGKTPYESTLKSGIHKIKLIPEGTKTKVVTWSGDVEIFDNSLTFISRELGTTELTSAGELLYMAKANSKVKNKGNIEIETEPIGAIVYLDNNEKGVSPLKMTDVPIGDHEISVFLPGFFRRSQKINVESGYTLQGFFKLALDQSNVTLEQELAKKRQEASEEARLKELAGKEQEKTVEKDLNSKNLTILDTPTGFLNVRSNPSVDSKVLTTVKPKEKHVYTEVTDGWYKIKANDVTGWVYGEYIEVN